VASFLDSLFQSAGRRNAGRKIGYALAAALIVGYGLIALRGPQGFQALLDKRREIQELQEQNTGRMRDNQRLRERIWRLRRSASEQEMEIRKQLKLLRPGETTFILPDAPSANSLKASPETAAEP
jgi:cell division protein FtsB